MYRVGAKFKVTSTKGNTTSEYITDDTGKILIENLNAEIYTIEEIVAPDGYLLEEQHKDVELEWGKTKQVVFTNKKRPVLTIKKIDSKTKEPLAGAKFKVTKTEDKTVSEYITDKTGTVTIEKLDESIYTVEEITAPEGYILEPQHKEIALEWGKNKTLVYEDTRKPTLIITKTNALTYKPIPNTTYKIEYEGQNGGITTLGTYRTDKNGQIILPKVEPGWYIITEIRPAQGFSKPSNIITRKYLAPGENAYTVINKEENTQQNENTITPPPTNANNSNNATPPPVNKDDVANKDVKITSGSDYNLGEEIINYPLNSIVIKKVDANTSELLDGAAFEVRKVTEDISGNSGTIIGRYTTDNSGVIVITGLEPGGYIIKEVKPPTNYLLSENSQQQAWLKADGTSIVEVTFANYPYGSLLVSKTDALTVKPLANARFKVTTGAGTAAGSSNGEFLTNENGEFLVSNLKPGSYIVTELEAPQNYVLDTTPQTVDIGTDGKVYKLSFKNQPVSTLVILKMDYNSKKPLANAEFKVTTSKGDVVGKGNGIFKTDETGTITIPNLPKGSYIVEEIKSPDGYLLENQSKTISIDYGKTYTLEFFNKPLASVIIKKFDSENKEPLIGAKFKISKKSGNVIGEYITDKNGMIQIDELQPGWYSAVEVKAPDGYLLNDTVKDFEIKTGKTVTVEFSNQKLTSLIIKKTDEKSGQPLSGAKFYVEKQNGEHVGEYTTDQDGTINIATLSPDWYVIREKLSPDGYLLDETPKTVEVKTNVPTVVTFTNKKLTALQIKKMDENSGEPLSGAKFIIERQNGEKMGEYTTDKAGSINIPELSPDWYMVKEIKSPNGYLLDETPKTVEVKTNVPTVVTFTNKKLTALQIKKVDENSGKPLSGAKFIVERQNGEKMGEYTTDKAGSINIPELSPDWYVVKEIKSPNGYLLDETPKTVEVKTNTPTVVTFTNKKLTALEIKKVSDTTGEPLSGAKFVVEKQNGEQIGEYTTDKSGSISISELSPDWYVVKEIKSPNGYLLDETPKTVEVKTNTPTVVTFVNKPLAALQIKKVDAQNNAPLAGAVFKITKHNGELIGEYKTETDGFINIPTLQPGYYTISEMKSPDGYLLDETPKTVEIKTNTPTLVTFTNKPLSGLKIIKLDSVTREPLKGVEFTIAKMNGEKVGSYKTDATGMIAVTNLEDGYYTVTETKALEGYISDKEPKTVEIKSGKPTILEVMNEPYPSLVIYKKAGNTGKPLAGVSFLVTKFNGEQIDTYKTDKSGMIVIEGLEEGKYLVKETETVKGYELDTEAKEVNIKYGKRTTLEVINNPLSSVIIRKIDSVTKEGIYGVTFLLYDEHDNPLGQFVSDNEGYVWLDRELEEGKYKLRELQPADGYLPDDVPRTIYVKAGQTTEITWENTPQKGQIVITKRSADYNALTGLPAGSPLAGASFEVYNMTGNLMDKMVSAENGVAASKPLPTGVYMVKEVSAPRYYAVNTKELYAEIRHNGDIVKFEFLDSSIDLNLTIDKKGANQISPGQTIAYELYNIKNQSSAVLENFYIHDRIPTDAARVTKIVTGTYSERLYYNITYKTNYKDYRTLAENLLTKNSYEYSLHTNALGLAAGEYVTDVRLEFTKASPGFQSLENMTVFCEVMPTIPKDYKVVNRADCGGRYGNEWESANTSWTTIVWKQDTPKTPLPKTGW
ncbi:SpaA isopeptide-forming pilin-related protein [Clostridium sp. MD294]|uniref:SpaA isopeptide-forming pilin-related protein n=1 Tax=Clostridium sp. MD294 TaxID=97138 RepID=UPI00325B8356